MLERATACLKSGARDSLRCAHNAPRSTRALHSAFWSHGAGDLEIIDANSQHLPQNDNVYDSTTSVKTFHEGIFLDFLYPPQALAWIRRANVHTSDPWERRNIRRLPEGFVQACRGFASRSVRHSKRRGTNVEHLVVDREVRDDENGEHRTKEAGTDLLIKHDNGVDNGDAFSNSGFEFSKSERSTEYRLGDTAIWESKISGEKFADSQQVLLSIMRLQVKNKEIVQKAWDAYNKLDNRDREDVRLKIELLNWMSKFAAKIADAHCISLYWSIPPGNRTLAVYSATLGAFLRRKDYDFATALQREALENIENALPISLALFSHAITRECWQLASEVLNNHLMDFTGLDRTRRQDLFWINAVNIPHLARRTAMLVKWIETEMKQDKDMSKLEVLSVALSKEALTHYLQQAFPDKIAETTSGDIFTLFQHVWKQPGQENFQFIEDSLVTMLQHSKADFELDSTRRLISKVYLLYKETSKTRPREDILMLMLDKTLAHTAAVNEVRESKTMISLDEILSDWKEFYGELSVEGLKRLFSHYVYTGDPGKVDEYFTQLAQKSADFEDYRDALSGLIYVHARRADLTEATRAFDRVMEFCVQNGVLPDIRCWNNLLYAHARIDDISGAMSTFDKLLKQRDLKPTAVSFQQILQMLGRQGDIDGINQFLEFYDDLLAENRPLSFTHPLMDAYIKIGDLEKARDVLTAAISRMHSGEDRGSLTPLFNLLVTAFALRRDLETIMELYEWMGKEGVQVDSLTYAAICQALVLSNRTGSAYKILRDVMPKRGIPAKAFHYAIIMTGFRRERNYKSAFAAREHMVKANIKESLGSKRADLKARIMFEHETTPSLSGESQPLDEVRREISEMIAMHDRDEALPKEPVLGYQNHDIEDMLALYITSVIHIHGRRQCFEVIKEVHQQYMSKSMDDGRGTPIPTIKLLSAFMSTHLAAGEYEEVEACWNMIQEQAEKEASLQSMSRFKSQTIQAAEGDESSGIQEDATDSFAEIGFAQAQGPEDESNEQIKPKPKPGVARRIRLAPTQRHILSGPLRFYIAAMARANRHVDTVKAVSKLLRQGYVLDHLTWNVFIKTLCTSSPPLALTAFAFMERYLTPQFPGWINSAKYNQGGRGLAYIRARYVKYRQVMPQYETMVRLRTALFQLRRIEATSGQTMAQDVSEELFRHIGSVRAIRERAPKTMFAVMSMPQVGNREHERLLHSMG